ncbi:MAG: hypothetical protein RR893_14210, partial [Clostridia bacterium]
MDYHSLHLKTVVELRQLAKAEGIKLPTGTPKARLVECLLDGYARRDAEKAAQAALQTQSPPAAPLPKRRGRPPKKKPEAPLATQALTPEQISLPMGLELEPRRPNQTAAPAKAPSRPHRAQAAPVAAQPIASTTGESLPAIEPLATVGASMLETISAPDAIAAPTQISRVTQPDFAASSENIDARPETSDAFVGEAAPAPEKTDALPRAAEAAERAPEKVRSSPENPASAEETKRPAPETPAAPGASAPESAPLDAPTGAPQKTTPSAPTR